MTGMRWLVACALLVAPGLLRAQEAQSPSAPRSVAEELRVNVHASGVMLGGGGAGARAMAPGVSASYGNSRWFAVFLTWDRASLNDGELDYRLQHIDWGVRVHLRGEQRAVVPFVLAGWTWRSARYGERLFLGDTMTVVVHGAGPTVGAGALYYLRPRLPVEVSLKRSHGAMERVLAGGDTWFRDPGSAIRAASVRLNAGVSWFPPVPHPR